MADTENKSDRYVLDSEPANPRKTGGVTVQRIPAKWMRRRDLEAFWRQNLEVKLIRENGLLHIEIGLKER